jgi:UDP-glucuronate 4-epimerase
MTLIETIENAMSKKAIKTMLPMQSGDVTATFAEIDGLKNAIGFVPRISLSAGIAKFIAWHKDYHGKD